MTARLPNPGGDDNTWGDILNTFLDISHNGDGTLQTTAVEQAGAITSVNGKTTTSGSITLAASDVNAPTTLAGDSDVNISGPSNNQVLAYNGSSSKWQNATLTESDVTNLTSDLSSKLAVANNLSDVADAGSSRANLHVPFLTLAAACGNDIGGTYNAPSGNNGATFVPFSGYVDGYYAAVGDMILLVNEAVNNQTGSTATAAANGVWQVQTAGAGGLWVRPTEFASGLTIKGRAITAMNGSSNSGPWYLQAPTAGVVIDTSSQSWKQGSGTWATSFSLIVPSGDSSGAADVANINAALTAGKGVFLVPGATYYINAPITPISKSFISGFQWSSASQQDNYGTGTGNPTGAVIQAVNFTGKAMILMENDTTSQYYGVDISGICLISYSGAMPTTSHGIAAYGYWGACFLRGVQIEKPGCDCLHLDQSPIVTSGFSDDWQVTDCKFSGARNGYGVNIANNVADSWFDNCESSENHLDGWSIGWVNNARFSNCKGENNGGNGWTFRGTGSTNPCMLSNCSAQLNNNNGFWFGGGQSGTAYMLTGCRSSNNSQTSGTYAGFWASGCTSKVIGTGCYATGDAYGAYEGTSSYGMWFTGSYFAGTTAATHDDGTNTNALVNNSPAFTAAPAIIDGVTVSGTPSAGQAIVATSATAAGWSSVPTSGANTFTGAQTAPAFIPSGLTGATAASRYVGATTSGAPTSGTFAVGDYIVDQTGALWICTAAGTPGTWTTVGGGSVTASSTTTFTNKRITKRVATLTDAATVTPATDSYDGGVLSSLSQSTTFATPTGTPTDFQQYVIRITSSSARALSWGAGYRGSAALPLPTTTTGAGAVDYIGFQYDASSSTWDLLAYVPGV